MIVDLNMEEVIDVDEAQIYAAIDYVLEFPEYLAGVETILVLGVITAILEQRKLTPRQVVDILEIHEEIRNQRAFTFN